MQLGGGSVSSNAAISGRRRGTDAWRETAAAAAWPSRYLLAAAGLDFLAALAAGFLAYELRFDRHGYTPAAYLALSTLLPVLWIASVALAGGYDQRFIGVGSDEFRKILNAAVCLTAGIAICSYAVKFELARGYVVLALPATAAFDLIARYRLRKALHRQRRGGRYMRRTVVVGHTPAVADLVSQLRRENHHGLSVVAVCLAGPPGQDEVAGVPVAGSLDSVASVVTEVGADTVAVLACPEMNGRRLRELAWDLEKSSTDMCVASALLDVAGPRTTIRPVAGLPLLHVDHPELAGTRQVVKGLFDKVLAALALLVLSPLFAVIALSIRVADSGPVFFRQTRVGRNGQAFRVWKFRTMVVDAEGRKTQLLALNDGAGVLFKMRRDPRVTRTGAILRRWSLDELPQLFNVLLGEMSLVGPRPALPSEAAMYGHHMRRRLAVRPGITGLWQVSGRSDLPWDEAERLDVRYVENWSLVLDVQILWKTLSAVLRGSGAY
jgi:exopolysaccharide biosynthesis polyprenyl glycosylphosphotransferase